MLKQTWITFNYKKKKPTTLQQGILIPLCYQYAAHTLSLNSEEYWVYFLCLYPFHKLNIIYSQGICFPFWIWILAVFAMFFVSEFSLYSSESLTTCWQKKRSSPYWCLQYLNTGTSMHIKIVLNCYYIVPHVVDPEIFSRGVGGGCLKDNCFFQGWVGGWVVSSIFWDNFTM